MEKQEVITLLPEISKIDDATLREGCVNVWLDGIYRGGWSSEELIALPFVIEELIDCPVTLIEHVHSVTSTAIMLQKQFELAYGEFLHADKDIVIAGALLHDVGKLLEYEKQCNSFGYSSHAKMLRHPLTGAMIAWQCGLPDKIVHIIATHSFEGAQSAQTLESFIVRNADWINFNYLSMKYPSTMDHK
jgi:putative nucleotidyltransferase with HDIG domain